jgi:hypothetical protein
MHGAQPHMPDGIKGLKRRKTTNILDVDDLFVSYLKLQTASK